MQVMLFFLFAEERKTLKFLVEIANKEMRKKKRNVYVCDRFLSVVY